MPHMTLPVVVSRSTLPVMPGTKTTGIDGVSRAAGTVTDGGAWLQALDPDAARRPIANTAARRRPRHLRLPAHCLRMKPVMEPSPIALPRPCSVYSG